jgi:hypothetical protein
MKRTNVILDEEILEKALKWSGEKTYSAVVNRALKEMVGRMAAAKLWSFAGMVEFDPEYIRTFRNGLLLRENEAALPDMISDAPVPDPDKLVEKAETPVRGSLRPRSR